MSDTVLASRGAMWKGLIWKETRQLLPLSLMLITVCLLLLACGAEFYPSRLLANQTQAIPLILPALFAVGAAAVLVGQEREQRTLDWLAALPIPASRLIAVKFVAAIGGLAVMWLACWILSLLINAVGFKPNAARPLLDGDSVDVCFLHLHSVFILVCGFYTAWKLKNTFASLIAILLLASLPFLLIETLYALRAQLWGYRFIVPAHSAAITMLVTIPAIAIVGWLAYRAAARSLAPAEPPSTASAGWAAWADPWRTQASTPAPAEPNRFSISSLVWQSIRQNRAALAGIVVMMSMGFAGLAALSYGEPGGFITGGLPAAAFGACWLGVSWLGVFVFSGDGNRRRVRFFAERGISPTKVFIGRQLVGLSILATFVLLYAWCSYRLPNADNGATLYLPSAAVAAIVVWVVYVASQWISQLISTLAASAILAPVVSCAAAYWLVISVVDFEAPLWLILMIGSAPLAAAWLMMHCYMDGSRRWPIWLTGVVVAVLFWLSPMIPLKLQVAQIPAMSAEVQDKLEQEARPVWRQSLRQVPRPITISESSNAGRDSFQELSGEAALQMLDQRSFGPRDLLSMPAADSAVSTPLTIEPYALQNAISSATYAKLRFQASPDDQSAIDSLGEWIGALTVIARGLRESNQLPDQEHADTIEIWLTQTLASPPIAQLWERPFYQQAVQLISDARSRSGGRRRAVLVSWFRWRLSRRGELPLGEALRMARSNSTSNFASLALQQRSASTIKQQWMHARLTEAITSAMLRLIDAGSADKPTEYIRRQLHELMIGSTIQFDDGPYAQRLRVGADSKPPFSTVLHGTRSSNYPASQWYAPWERDAANLARSGQEVDKAEPVSEGGRS